MLRQCLHGSLVVGEVIGNGLQIEAHWGLLLLLPAAAIAGVNALGVARRVSDALICVRPISDPY